MENLISSSDCKDNLAIVLTHESRLLEFLRGRIYTSKYMDEFPFKEVFELKQNANKQKNTTNNKKLLLQVGSKYIRVLLNISWKATESVK